MTERQINFYGNTSNVQIQQDTENSSQTQTINNACDYDKIMDIIQQLSVESSSFGLNNAQQDELFELLTSVKKAVAEKEAPSKIKQGLNLLKEFLLRTSTTLAATGAVQLITTLIDSM